MLGSVWFNRESIYSILLQKLLLIDASSKISLINKPWRWPKIFVGNYINLNITWLWWNRNNNNITAVRHKPTKQQNNMRKNKNVKEKNVKTRRTASASGKNNKWKREIQTRKQISFGLKIMWKRLSKRNYHSKRQHFNIMENKI